MDTARIVAITRLRTIGAGSIESAADLRRDFSRQAMGFRIQHLRFVVLASNTGVDEFALTIATGVPWLHR